MPRVDAGSDPGPIPYLTPPAAIDIFGGPVFAPLIEDVLGGYQTGELVLPQAHLDVAGEGIPDVDGGYHAALGSAIDSTENEIAAGIDGTPYALIENGGNVDVHNNAVQPYLPPPDASVPSDYDNPPALPPLGGTPGGTDGGTPTGAPEEG